VTETDDDYFEPPRRNGVTRAIVAIVVVAATGLLGWAAEKRFHFTELLAQRARPAQQTDVRGPTWLDEGERALVAGDLGAAQGAFDKASVLMDRDPRLLVDLARVAAAKADVPWLQMRLLGREDADEMRVAHAELMENAAAATRAAQDALTAKPDDPQAFRAKIDALRLAGDVDGARALVAAIMGQSTQPETAYVLGALDLAGPSPAWQTAIDRLRFAAAGDWNSGRARAALVYALARSGDAPGARAEMAKLDAMPRPYPCLGGLRTLLAPKPVDAGADAADAAVDGAAARGAVAAAGGGGGGGGGYGGGSGEDYPGIGTGAGDNTTRGAILMASQAMESRDYGRAEQIYTGILTNNPGDSQAIAGLGDIARARGDLTGAITNYRRAVAVNGSYLPALIGLADSQWQKGDKPAAVQVYKNIEDHFPEGTYPDYVKIRASGGQ
jgi:tetratricopeptide (TPR) repeat protein